MGLALVSWAFARVGVHCLFLHLPYLSVFPFTLFHLPLYFICLFFMVAESPPRHQTNCGPYIKHHINADSFVQWHLFGTLVVELYAYRTRLHCRAAFHLHFVVYRSLVLLGFALVLKELWIKTVCELNSYKLMSFAKSCSLNSFVKLRVLILEPGHLDEDRMRALIKVFIYFVVHLINQYYKSVVPKLFLMAAPLLDPDFPKTPSVKL